MKPLVWCFTVLYPLLMYVSFRSGYRLGAISLCGVIVAGKVWEVSRATLSWGGRMLVAPAAGATVVALSLTQERAPLFLPVFINLMLAVVFGVSLRFPPTVIERFARRMQPDLPIRGVHYCRKVCWVWVCFFILNTVVAFDSVFRSFAWWSLYNGVVSYALVGCLFVGEYVVRRRVMRDLYPKKVVCATLLIGSLLLCGAPTFGDPMTREQLTERLRVSAPFRAPFSEQRRVAVLSAPLESRGEIQCLPGVGIVWRTERPIQMVDVITPTSIVRRSRRGEREATKDRAGISATLLALMSGDVAGAEDRFSVTLEGTADSWSVKLTPRDTLVAEVIQAIVVSGSGRPEALEVVHASGDTVRTTFGEITPLLPDEIAQTREFIAANVKN